MAEAELTGRELDAAVAERVMGFVRHKSGVLLPDDDHLNLWFDHAMEAEAAKGELWVRVPRYSDSVVAVMDVVEKLRSVGTGIKIEMYHHFDGKVFVEMNVPSSECQEWGDTLPEAICKCALKAQAKWELFTERVAALAKESK